MKRLTYGILLMLGMLLASASCGKTPEPGNKPNQEQGNGNGDNNGDNGGNTTPEPPSFGMNAIYVFNQRAVYDEATSTFKVVMPTRTDFSELKVDFLTQGYPVEILVNGEPVITGSKMDLTEPVKVTLKCQEYTKDYTLIAKNTGLPIVRIKTPDSAGINSKEVWLEGAEMTIELADGTLDYEGTMSIKGRGNSTWNYPKKPYALKLDSKSKILGMPKHKRWILLANWKDRTLLRNDAAFWLSRTAPSIDYTVRGQFVELELNGSHRGNYYLCEQIKIDANRLNINKMADFETDPEKITGGYIMELDTYFDEPLKFRSPRYNLPYQFKDPDDSGLSAEAVDYFKGFIANLEDLLADTERVKNHEYEEYFDVDSSIDYMFVEELTNNTDFYNYWPSEGSHSVYLYKEQNGKLYSGPAWDFDYHGFVPNLSYQWAGANKATYYPRLYKDDKYRNRMLQKWEEEKDAFLGLSEYIDQMADYIRESEEVNHRLWPISNDENGDEKMTFQQSVDRIKDGFKKKHDWMTKHLKDLK